MKEVALRQLPAQDVPPELPVRISAALDTPAERVGPGASPSLARRRKPVLVGAVLTAGAMLLLLVTRTPTASLPGALARDFSDYRNQALTLDLESSDPLTVEDFFAKRGIAFPTRVFDLRMMKYDLVGGRVHTLRGRHSALFAYRGPEDRDLVCQMYEGRLSELPQAGEVREHNGITFGVYRVGWVTLVFWQEGAVVCMLASDANPDEVLQLAYAKAVKV